MFGNRSSNAEFEVLCGVPAAVGPADVVFWRVDRDLPCLPRLLASHGYRSLALHPSPRRIFNLSEAYPALGFERFAFAEDLDFADRDGQFLSAKATLDQHWERIRPLLDGERPVLSYAFVNASHFPYERNTRRRPDRWRQLGASAMVARYLNAMHYMTLAVDRFVARVLAKDADSLILIVGDHQPALGPNLAGQREGGLVSTDDDDPFAHKKIYEVPLMLLDRGQMVPLDALPIYLLPYVLLERLGACGPLGCGWDGQARLRPFRDHVLLVERNGVAERTCSVRDPEPACETAARQARAWQVELLDLLDGASQADPRTARQPGA